jgi:hypothetical protein
MDNGKNNQNIWALAISFAFLGASEHFNLPLLGRFALVATIATTIVYLISIVVYTKRYCADRWKVKEVKEPREQREHRDRGQRPQQHQRNPPRPPQSTN